MVLNVGLVSMVLVIIQLPNRYTLATVRSLMHGDKCHSGSSLPVSLLDTIELFTAVSRMALSASSSLSSCSSQPATA
jgi:hypothetical protein